MGLMGFDMKVSTGSTPGISTCTNQEQWEPGLGLRYWEGQPPRQRRPVLLNHPALARTQPSSAGLAAAVAGPSVSKYRASLGCCDKASSWKVVWVGKCDGRTDHGHHAGAARPEAESTLLSSVQQPQRSSSCTAPPSCCRCRCPPSCCQSRPSLLPPRPTAVAAAPAGAPPLPAPLAGMRRVPCTASSWLLDSEAREAGGWCDWRACWAAGRWEPQASRLRDADSDQARGMAIAAFRAHLWWPAAAAAAPPSWQMGVAGISMAGAAPTLNYIEVQWDRSCHGPSLLGHLPLVFPPQLPRAAPDRAGSRLVPDKWSAPSPQSCTTAACTHCVQLACAGACGS